jgi:hypothetical protein
VTAYAYATTPLQGIQFTPLLYMITDKIVLR